MSDVRDMSGDDEGVTFMYNDVVEYIGDSYSSIPNGDRGLVVDVFPVKHGLAYAVHFEHGILESYVCFDGDLRKAVGPVSLTPKVVH